MLPEEMQYILYRRKSQGHFANGVPYEYSASRIRSDMKHAGWVDPPSEEEIRDFLEIKRNSLHDRILEMARGGSTMADIRTWCEYSLDCIIPIPSLSQITAENILSRYDYFNFEINKVAREEQVDILIAKRREMGPETSMPLIIEEMEKKGIFNLTDEITRTDFYTEGDLLRILMDLEEEALSEIREFTKEGLSTPEILRKLSEDRSPIFTDSELHEMVNTSVRKNRISIIADSVRSMTVSEIWSFIDGVKAFQALRTSHNGAGPISERLGIDPSVVEKIGEYVEGKEIEPDDPYFQLYRLTLRDYAQLVKLLRAYVVWRRLFAFVRPLEASTSRDLMRAIIEGFSEENGIDPDLFELFLY